MSFGYFSSASSMAASAQMLWAGTVSEPTKTAYSPSALPMALTMASSAASPNALLSIISTSKSAFFWSGDSCVIVTIFCPRARANTGSIDLASFGTTRMALLPWLMASSMSLTCCASSAEAGACWLTLIL